MVLIEKPTQGYRPLTILPIAWRIGARVLVKQLTSWVERWASWRVLGGVAHRGLKDSYLRLLESLSSPRFYLQEDLTKFFDSVRRTLWRFFGTSGARLVCGSWCRATTRSTGGSSLRTACWETSGTLFAGAWRRAVP